MQQIDNPILELLQVPPLPVNPEDNAELDVHSTANEFPRETAHGKAYLIACALKAGVPARPPREGATIAEHRKWINDFFNPAINDIRDALTQWKYSESAEIPSDLTQGIEYKSKSWHSKNNDWKGKQSSLFVVQKAKIGDWLNEANSTFSEAPNTIGAEALVGMLHALINLDPKSSKVEALVPLFGTIYEDKVKGMCRPGFAERLYLAAYEIETSINANKEGLDLPADEALKQYASTYMNTFLDANGQPSALLQVLAQFYGLKYLENMEMRVEQHQYPALLSDPVISEAVKAALSYIVDVLDLPAISAKFIHKPKYIEDMLSNLILKEDGYVEGEGYERWEDVTEDYSYVTDDLTGRIRKIIFSHIAPEHAEAVFSHLLDALGVPKAELLPSEAQMVREILRLPQKIDVIVERGIVQIGTEQFTEEQRQELAAAMTNAEIFTQIGGQEITTLSKCSQLHEKYILEKRQELSTETHGVKLPDRERAAKFLKHAVRLSLLNLEIGAPLLRLFALTKSDYRACEEELPLAALDRDTLGGWFLLNNQDQMHQKNFYERHFTRFKGVSSYSDCLALMRDAFREGKEHFIPSSYSAAYASYNRFYSTHSNRPALGKQPRSYSLLGAVPYDASTPDWKANVSEFQRLLLNSQDDKWRLERFSQDDRVRAILYHANAVQSSRDHQILLKYLKGLSAKQLDVLSEAFRYLPQCIRSDISLIDLAVEANVSNLKILATIDQELHIHYVRKNFKCRRYGLEHNIDFSLITDSKLLIDLGKAYPAKVPEILKSLSMQRIEKGNIATNFVYEHPLAITHMTREQIVQKYHQNTQAFTNMVLEQDGQVHQTLLKKLPVEVLNDTQFLVRLLAKDMSYIRLLPSTIAVQAMMNLPYCVDYNGSRLDLDAEDKYWRDSVFESAIGKVSPETLYLFARIYSSFPNKSDLYLKRYSSSAGEIPIEVALKLLENCNPNQAIDQNTILHVLRHTPFDSYDRSRLKFKFKVFDVDFASKLEAFRALNMCNTDTVLIGKVSITLDDSCRYYEYSMYRFNPAFLDHLPTATDFMKKGGGLKQIPGDLFEEHTEEFLDTLTSWDLLEQLYDGADHIQHHIPEYDGLFERLFTAGGWNMDLGEDSNIPLRRVLRDNSEAFSALVRRHPVVALHEILSMNLGCLAATLISFPLAVLNASMWTVYEYALNALQFVFCACIESFKQIALTSIKAPVKAISLLKSSCASLTSSSASSAHTLNITKKL